MLDVINYANLLQYSPRGKGEISIKSQAITGAIKGGRISPSIPKLIIKHGAYLADFLNEEVTLVPTPRSSPIRETDLWPTLEIVKMLAALKLGNISTCLFRTTPVKKSSQNYTGEHRPSILEQYNSLAVKNVVPTSNITLVDDVVTMGRTSIAAASRLAEKFPNANIRLFALVRTMGFVDDIDIIEKCEQGTITYYPASGKCFRSP